MPPPSGLHPLSPTLQPPPSGLHLPTSTLQPPHSTFLPLASGFQPLASSHWPLGSGLHLRASSLWLPASCLQLPAFSLWPSATILKPTAWVLNLYSNSAAYSSIPPSNSSRWFSDPFRSPQQPQTSGFMPHASCLMPPAFDQGPLANSGLQPLFSSFWPPGSGLQLPASGFQPLASCLLPPASNLQLQASQTPLRPFRSP